MDLLSDEEIFAERETEYNSLQSQYKLLVERNIELECLVTTLTDKEHSLQQEVRCIYRYNCIVHAMVFYYEKYCCSSNILHNNL